MLDIHYIPVFFKNWYSQGAYKFMTMYNQIMDANLDPLEDLACEHAWRNSPSRVAAAPMSPGGDSGIRSVSPEMEINAPTTQNMRARSKSLDDPPFISC